MPFAERKRYRILSAALEVFVTKGFEKSSLEEIAAHARVGKTTIYYYFSSKEEMFVLAVKEAYNRYFTEIESKLAEVSGFEKRFRIVLKIPVRQIFEHMPILMEAQARVTEESRVVLGEMISDGRARLLGILRNIFEEGIETGTLDERVSVEDAINIIHDWLMMVEINLSAPYREMILRRLERDRDKLIDMILYGIIKRG